MSNKEKMITRTITFTKAIALVADLGSNEITSQFYTIMGRHTAESALAKIKKQFESDTVKILTVKDIDVCEKLYGIPESVFFEHAQELPPR